MTIQEIEQIRQHDPHEAYNISHDKLNTTPYDHVDRLGLGRIATVSALSLANNSIVPKSVVDWLSLAYFELKRTHLNPYISSQYAKHDLASPDQRIAAEMSRDIARYNIAASATDRFPGLHFLLASQTLAAAYNIAPSHPSCQLARIEQAWLNTRQRGDTDPNLSAVFLEFMQSGQTGIDRKIDVANKSLAVGKVHRDRELIDTVMSTSALYISRAKTTKAELKYQAEIARSLVLPFLFILTRTPSVNPISV